tara:strand:- start:49 stop:279 length:231 start_codon:yes stop_codon:yes gene_type:complete
MRKISLIIGMSMFTFMFGLYNVGQTVSTADQNIAVDVCNGQNPYNGSTSSFKLADLNGATNGGQYYVFHIDMAASW